ncbi:MAG: hypothetical protein IKX23_02800 [Treponema sp.]|nr:hypothetical protein [Treponema sp.]
MKNVILTFCLIFTVLICISCKSNASTKTSNTDPKIQISISTEHPDFTLDYTYDASIYMYTFNVVSSITFDELTWYLNNSKLIGTENQMKINTSAIAKKGIYHMLVTGVNNGIVYSAEIMFTVY